MKVILNRNLLLKAHGLSYGILSFIFHLTTIRPSDSLSDSYFIITFRGCHCHKDPKYLVALTGPIGLFGLLADW